MTLKVQKFAILALSCTFWPPVGTPLGGWDNRGKCYMDRQRIQCLSNAWQSQHVPIYLQPFLRYSKLLVENCDIFTPHLCLAAPSEFREDLDKHKSDKTRMNGLSCGEEIMAICSAVLIQYQRVTDRRTDGRRDVQPISITCFSIADARKNRSPVSNLYLTEVAAPTTLISVMFYYQRQRTTVKCLNVL